MFELIAAPHTPLDDESGALAVEAVTRQDLGRIGFFHWIREPGPP